MQHAPYSRKLRQLDLRIQEWNKAVHSGAPVETILRLQNRIALLLKSLSGVVSRSRLAAKLATASIVGGLTFPVLGQTFAAPIENPFGFVVDSTNYVGGICAADFDNDGDYDLMMGGYFGTIDYLENTGSPESPVFSSTQTNPFGLISSYYYAFLTAADLDNDGDFDILAGEYNGSHLYYKNVGTPDAPLFTIPVANTFGLGQGSYISMPEFVDLDGDGDYDVISGEAGGLIYFKNEGTSGVPGFAPAINNPFGLVPNNVYFSYPAVGDLDLDGDYDMLIGETGGNLRYMQNSGTPGAPFFELGQLNPFGIVGGVAPVVLPELVDLDNDGDLDILASGYEGSLWFFENTAFNLGIDAVQNTLLVGPNPFQNELHISSSEYTIDVAMLVDITGKSVFIENNPTNTLQLQHVATGLYSLVLIDSTGRKLQQKVEKF